MRRAVLISTRHGHTPALTRTGCQSSWTSSSLLSPSGQGQGQQQQRLLHSKSRDCQEAAAVGTRAKLPENEEAIPESRKGITIADILERRAKAGKLVAMTAAAADSDMFKASQVGKPMAKRWDNHLSAEARIREPCVLKKAAKNLKKPGIISLGGGLPCPEYFPFESITMKVPTAPNFSEAATRTSGKEITIGKYDVSQSASQKDGPVYDLSIALNYGQAHGSAQVMRFVTEHTELVSNPPYADWQSCLTVGSTAALEQALRMLCDRQRGDSILTEEYSFSTALETAMPLGAKVFGVKMDEQGLLPESMDEMLSNWDSTQRGGARKPHVLYTVPSGQNPTGATQGEQRRRDIYAVCQKHDLYIIEDEPYYYLQMHDYAAATKPATIDNFLDNLIPTLLSMDVDGRVMRMDSFSKVVVPGSRLGWITASAQIIERYIRHAEVCNQGPSGFSQVILHKLLDEEWGHEGYLAWLMNLSGEYTKRRDVMMDACDKFLPKQIVSWSVPKAGMFHWIKVAYPLHPDASSKSLLQVEEEIFNLCIEKGVLIARGSWFRAEQHNKISPSSSVPAATTPQEQTDMFFRATFAAATPENMTEAIRRFGEAIKESYGL
ncbi:Aromatic/aminoadipate aminotransferase 1 [Rhypophila decipiens]|uniref:aromatic-amino-acid transaminase n=1 Tax=Rhypophila decipiens TaxID=261697 RepID=A0AAN6YGE4_9PEZI|nr:Aromatic/aminoadipate aminotransferase 1 [Rhypophila decipiens]